MNKKQLFKARNNINIFEYHNYRRFLRDLLNELKASHLKLSLTSMSEKSGVSVSNLTMILNNQRNLSQNVLQKLVKVLPLHRNEVAYLKLLVKFDEAQNVDEKNEILKKFRRFHEYSFINPDEKTTTQYLGDWINVALREMTNLSDFRFDTSWMRKRLILNTDTSRIHKSFEFLTENKFVNQTTAESGEFRSSEKIVECKGDVLGVSLKKFHKSILKLLAELIDYVPRHKRFIMGHTVTLDDESFEQAKEIIESAIKKLQDLDCKDANSQNVYHLTVGAFPLTKAIEDEK